MRDCACVRGRYVLGHKHGALEQRSRHVLLALLRLAVVLGRRRRRRRRRRRTGRAQRYGSRGQRLAVHGPWRRAGDRRRAPRRGARWPRSGGGRRRSRRIIVRIRFCGKHTHVPYSSRSTGPPGAGAGAAAAGIGTPAVRAAEVTLLGRRSRGGAGAGAAGVSSSDESDTGRAGAWPGRYRATGRDTRSLIARNVERKKR